MFSESSKVEMQLPCCPGKQGELTKPITQVTARPSTRITTNFPLLHVIQQFGGAEA